MAARILAPEAGRTWRLWAADEVEGRLEMLLSAPLARNRWVIAGGLGAIGAVAVMTVLFGAGTGLGQPMVGAWDPVGIVACLVIAIGGVVLGAWGMARRDVD